MPFLQGFVGGINEGLSRSQQEAREESTRMDELERNIFTTLASSDDPEIASLALAGLTSLASPRGRPKGLRRLIGEVEGSPMLGQMRSLLQTPTTRQVTEPGEVRPAPGEAGMPRRPYQGLFGAAALPEQAAVEFGAEPMTGAPPQVDLTPTRGPDVTRTVTEPRRAFRTSEEKLAAELRARGGAALEMLQGAKTPEERRVLSGMLGAPDREPQFSEGEIIEDPQSETGYSQILYDREDPSRTRRIPSGPPRVAGLRGTKVEDPTSRTGWSQVFSHPDGTEAYRVQGVAPSYPPPAYSGVYYTPGPGGTQVPVGITRGGGTQELPGAPPKAPAAGPTSPVWAQADALLTELDKAVKEGSPMGFTSPGLRESTFKTLLPKYPALAGKTYSEILQIHSGGKTGPPPGVEGQPSTPSGNLEIDINKVLDLIRQRQKVGGRR